MIGPKTMNKQGIEKAVKVLLDTIPETYSTTKKIWFCGGKGTQYISDVINKWQEQTCKANGQTTNMKTVDTDKPTTSKIISKPYGFAIWVPTAEKLESVMRAALNKETHMNMNSIVVSCTELKLNCN